MAIRKMITRTIILKCLLLQNDQITDPFPILVQTKMTDKDPKLVTNMPINNNNKSHQPVQYQSDPKFITNSSL